MRLEYLYYFKHLAEVLNYTKAAGDLYVAQPTLSTAMKRMENELGFPLFERDGSKMALTAPGKAFYDNVKPMLASYERGLTLAHEAQGQERTDLHIAATNPIQTRDFAKALLDFKKSRPITPFIKVDHGYEIDLVKRLRDGELDVLFGSELPNMQDLSLTYFWSQPLVAAVNVDNPLASRSSVSIEDLRGYELITYRADLTPDCHKIADLLNAHNLECRYEIDQEINMASIISSETKTVALPYYSSWLDAYKDIVCLPIEGLELDFHKLYMICRREYHPQIVQQFIDFMKQYRMPENRGPVA